MERNKRRWIELGKDLLIALLSLSAAALLLASPLAQGSGLGRLLDQGTGQSALAAGTAQSIPAAAVPVRMTVRTQAGLYGAQYDDEAVRSLFDTAGPLLGEALCHAGEPEPLGEAMADAGETRRSLSADPSLSADEGQWRELLASPHIYFCYAQPVPLSVLGSWLTPEESSSGLEGSARQILLTAFSNGSVALCWLDESGGFYLSKTGLDASLHLDHIVESVTPNNAFFAFDGGALPIEVDPYTLFTGQDLYAPVYLSTDPVPISDSAQVSRLLGALSFSDLNRAEGSDSAIYVDGDDTIRLHPNGMVRCHTVKGRYAAGPGIQGAVESAWSLASAALEPFIGEARLYLYSVQEKGGVCTVSFGYLLNGRPVTLHDRDWCAQFTVQDGAVSEFTLYLRAYAPAGRDALLLPEERAAAALAALTDDPRELIVQYQDAGDGTVEPGWVGRSASVGA